MLCEIRSSGINAASMRRLLLRLCVLVLSLALVSGNAHATLHLDNAHHEPWPEEHAQHPGRTPFHQHRHDHGLACCCVCLGCSSAVYISPALGLTPANFTARVYYDALTAFLSGGTLRPDPDPPRPGLLG